MSHVLSIITINYNNAQGLKKTMASVERQTWNAFEHIIIDGNSSDNSLEVIKSFNYNNLSYICESDTGIYNAMNKGIKMAKGEYLLFLNSGDYLYNKNTLSKVQDNFKSEISFLCGNMYYENPNNLILREHPNIITFSYLISKTISHPSTFIKKSMFDIYGLYNENLRIVSDWEFFLKCVGLNGETYKKINSDITVFNTDGISSKEQNLNLVKEEKLIVLQNYLPTIFNNENDKYIFSHFKETSKRFKYLIQIDKNPFFRKVATFMLRIDLMFLHISNYFKK
ncbi:glycosyltransferase [Winogradskyella echinorum]|uniref:Glycosyltransferase n=1 Tax=Winogradskyella echinorum TaxID=538189 RepID=A0ABR6Y3X7_9FLAO|nr:glycosyltransferase family 2 protein [Winogradskyella echinorum]MBC3846948.1 glycosyltransferase [Winogradskyella echinorum]MBC5751296.1 glycosyltransferase [Winogradskyella echinorum]